MAKCAQCGNDYDKTFEISMGGRTMIFDSFECAMAALAPTCPHCAVVGWAGDNWEAAH
jgi:hypothetical protein